MGFPKRYDGELRETLFRSQGSQVSMRMAMGSRSLLSSHGRGRTEVGLRPRGWPLSLCCPESVSGYELAGRGSRCSVALLLGGLHSPVGQSGGAAWGGGRWCLGGAQVGAEELPVEWVVEGKVLELTWRGKERPEEERISKWEVKRK